MLNKVNIFCVNIIYKFLYILQLLNKHKMTLFNFYYYFAEYLIGDKF